MKSRLLICLVAAALGVVRFSFADDSPSPLVTTAYQRVNLFDGPGITYHLSDTIAAGVPLTIVERNNVGTWVHVQRTDANGELLDDGWIISGYLNLDPDLHFGWLPINTTLPDADLALVPDQLRELSAAPIIPPVSDAVRDLFTHGRDDLRNYSYVITKVGDSITADPLYLKPMSLNRRVLGAYDYLATTIDYFAASTQVDSVAARVGMTTFTVLDPMWADKQVCERGETPLDCEYRRKRPSVAFIMFGPNDLLHNGPDTYEENIRTIVDKTIERGIIPVLSTFSYDPGMGLWNRSVLFNERLIEIANEYQIPIINLWLAARALPNWGLENDQTHMKHWGYEYLKFDDGHVAFSGAALRNLLSIRMLDEIRTTVILDLNAAG